MKKIFSIIAICLALVLSVPAVPVHAMDTSRILIRTSTSVGNPWQVTSLDNVQHQICSLPDNLVNKVYEALADFDQTIFNNYGYYIISVHSEDYSLYSLYITLFDSSDTPYIIVRGIGDHANDTSTGIRYCNNTIVAKTTSVNSYSVVFSASTVGDWSSSQPYQLGASYGTLGYNYQSSSTTASSAILDTNVGAVWWSTDVEGGASYYDNINGTYNSSNVADWAVTHPDKCRNFFDNLDGYDSDGNITSPEDLPPVVEYESNKNHMYFKDCEIGFCYPKTSPSPVSFGGAYFYIKYTVDDWIVNHISDYNLVFYADAEVGNDVTNTIRYEIALDPDGCITIPFSRIWSTPLTSKGFSVLVTDREIEDNFYKAYLYSLSSSGFVNFGNKAAASNQNSISGALNALSSGGIESFLYYINGDSIDLYSALSEVATSIAVKYNPYLITAFTLLTDGTDNSGLFEMEFDLVAGTEDVTDTGGLVNPDPFVPDDDPDYTPPAPTPGNSTTPGYNIVPSGFWQGTMNAVIGYDPGYRDLKSDIDRDPNGNFSQYLDPMHNDDVGSWFMSFVDEMPTEMKSILIAGVGVGVLFGLYRFIRRG